MAKPKYLLETGGSNHGIMTGKMLQEIEPILLQETPEAVVVYGDTNSTIAGSLAAAKLQIPVIHIESGLRSYNRSMPEEINRVLTDHISSLLIVPTKQAIDNLNKEGIHEHIYLTGDVMCDMIRICKEKNLIQTDQHEAYYYATLHRPYNTDEPKRLEQILTEFQKLDAPVKFFVHPRTQKKIKETLNIDALNNIIFEEPLSYFDNIKTMANSQCIITDSGGIQKEAYILRKKCITIRSETEWIETLQGNWNTLIWENLQELKNSISAPVSEYQDGLYGDGHAAEQIVELILKRLEKK